MRMSETYWVPRIGSYYDVVKEYYRCFDNGELMVGSEPYTNYQTSVKLYLEHCGVYGEDEGIQCDDPATLAEFWADYQIIFISAFKQVDMADHKETISDIIKVDFLTPAMNQRQSVIYEMNQNEFYDKDDDWVGFSSYEPEPYNFFSRHAPSKLNGPVKQRLKVDPSAADSAFLPEFTI